MRRLVGICLLVTTVSFAVPAAALDFAGDSELDAWAMNASLMVQGGESRADEVAGAPCRTIHDAIDRYQESPPTEGEVPPEGLEWPEFIAHYDLSPGQIRSLVVRYGFADTDIETCTEMHIDGWLQADDRIVELATNEDPGSIIVIADVGEAKCDHGQVLLASASYYWSIVSERWEYDFGTNWTEEFFGGFTVTADLEFRCVEVVPPDTDFASVAEAVPSSQVNLNPLVQGLTGLDTWLWYEFTTPDTYSIGPLTVTVNEYGRNWTLTAWAWVDSVHWDVDCESSCDFRGDYDIWDSTGIDYSFDFPDTPQSMAVAYDGGAPSDSDALRTHLYEEKGDFTVATAAVWRGYYVSNGVPTLYDPVVVVTERPYEVVEIRGVLTARDG